MVWSYNDFPKLTDEQNNELLRRLHEGDTDAREQLIIGNMRLVIYVARKFKGHDLDDVIAAGSLGLISAVDNFSAERDNFASFAQTCIYNSILKTYWQNERRHRTCLSLDEPLMEEVAGEDVVTHLDMLEADDDTEVDADFRINCDTLYKALELLSYEERLFIERRYGLNGRERETQVKIAAERGTSKERMSKYEAKIIDKIRKVFEGRMIR